MQGGLNYVDLQIKIKALNIKFLFGLETCKSSRKILPELWIYNCFKQSSNVKEADLDYYEDYFKNCLNILGQCFFKLPRKLKWKGHPFYYECLETIQKLTNKLPETIHELLSTSLWHNRFLGTKFDCQLSREGFNCVKDLGMDRERLSKSKKKILLKIGENLGQLANDKIFQNVNLNTVVYPQISLITGENQMTSLKHLNCKQIYKILIDKKVRGPIGMMNLQTKLGLTEDQVKNAFIFSNECTVSTKYRHFQYRINTYTLATWEYLYNYKVNLDYSCLKCESLYGEQSTHFMPAQHFNLFS